MKVLLIATESSPYFTGSELANAVFGMAQALCSLGHDARIILPDYREKSIPKFHTQSLVTLSIPIGDYARPTEIKKRVFDSGPVSESTVSEEEKTQDAPITYLVHQEFYFGRQDIYGYSDDYERFIFFSRAVLEMLKDRTFQRSENWIPDIIQGFDWTTSLIPLWLPGYPSLRDTRFCLYVYNTQKLGLSNGRALQLARLNELGIYKQVHETPQKINLLGRGLLFSSRLFFSGRFEREGGRLALSTKFNGLLDERQGYWSCLPEAISYSLYNPESDELIYRKFGQDSIRNARVQNKLSLQAELTIKVDGTIPLIGVVSRHPYNPEALLELLQGLPVEPETQFVIMADAYDAEMEANFQQIERRNLTIKNLYGYDDKWARRIFAACDICISLEAENSNSSDYLIAMHYGALPIVPDFGASRMLVVPAGSNSQVRPASLNPEAGFGFVFNPQKTDTLLAAVQQAIRLYCADMLSWSQLQFVNMRCDLSWTRLVHILVEEYELARSTVPPEIFAGSPRPFDPQIRLFEALLEIDGLPGLADRKDLDMLKQAARIVREMVECDAVYVWGVGGNFQLYSGFQASEKFNFIEKSLNLQRAGPEPDILEVKKLVTHGVRNPWHQFTDVDRDVLCQPILGLNDSPFNDQWEMGRSVPVTAHSRILGRIDVFFTHEQVQKLSSRLKAGLDWLDGGLTALANSIGMRMEAIRIAREGDHISTLSRELNRCQTVNDVSLTLNRLSMELLDGSSAWFYLKKGDQFEPVPDNEVTRAARSLAVFCLTDPGTAYLPDWNISPQQNGTYQFRSLLMARMVLNSEQPDEQVIGVLAAAQAQPAGFDRDDDHLFRKHFASQAAVSLERALRGKLNESNRVHQLELLADSLVGEGGFEKLLERIVKTTAEVLHAQAASLYLVPTNKPGTLEIRAGAGYHAPLAEIKPRLTYNFGEGVTGTIATEKEVFIANSADELRAHNHKGKYTHLQNDYTPDNFIGIPLMIGGEVLGVLKLETSMTTGGQTAFGDEDRNLGMMMANVIAAVVYNHQRDELHLTGFRDKLHELSKTLAGKEGRQDKAALMANIVQTIMRVLGADAASLYLLDEISQRLVIQATSGYQKPLEDARVQYSWGEGKVSYAWGEGVTGGIASNNASFGASNLAELRKGHSDRGTFDYLHIDGHQPTSFYGTPLNVTGRSRPIGVLKVESLKADFFPTESQLLIDMMANVVAAVVYNYELGESSLKEFSQKLKALSDALAGNQEKPQLMKNIVETIMGVLNANAASLYLWDEKSQRLVIQAASGYQAPLENARVSYEWGIGKVSYAWGQGVTGKIAAEKRSFRANSLHRLREKGQADSGTFDYLHIDKKTPNSFYGTPLTVTGRDRPIGVLKLESLSENFFPDESERLIDMMANVVATVIYNSQLGDEKLQKFSKNLGSLSTALSGSLDQESLMDSIVNTILIEMDLDAVSIYLADDKFERLICRAAAGYQKPLKAAQAFYFWGDGVTGKIAEEKEKFFAPTLNILRAKGKSKRGKYDHLQGSRQPSSFYGIPLIARGADKPIGVLKAESEKPRFFSSEDELLFELMGQVITTVVYNSQQDMNRMVSIITDLGSLERPAPDPSQKILTRLVKEHNSRNLELAANSLARIIGDNRQRALNEGVRLLQTGVSPTLFSYLASAAQSDAIRPLLALFDQAAHSSLIQRERIEDVFQFSVSWDTLRQCCHEGEDIQTSAVAVMEHLARVLQCKLLPNREACGSWRGFLLDTHDTFTNLKLPKQLLFAFYQNGFYKQEKLVAEDLRQLIAQAGENVGQLVIPFVGNPEVFSAVRSALRRNFAASSIDIILTESAHLQEIIGCALPALQLQRAILAQANLKILSPYTASGATDAQVFFGREEEKNHIRQNAQSQSFAILGGRQHGKTSLLHRLTLDVLPNDPLGYCTTMITCQGFRNLNEFYDTRLGWYPEPPPSAPQTVGELLKLPPQKHGRHIVLLIDEIDALIRLDRLAGWKAFNDLRAFSDTRAGQLVCSGAYMFDQALRDTTGMDSSPFQNFFQKIFYLEPLTQEQVYELVVHTMDELLGVKFDDSDSVVQRIFEFTNGQPCLIQRICTRLIPILEAKENRRVTGDMLRRLLADHEYLEEDYLQVIYTALRPLEKLVLLVMMERKTANEAALQAELELRAGFHNHLELHQALQWMIDLHNILVRTESGAYMFRLKSLPRILKQKISMPFEFDAKVVELVGESGTPKEQNDL